MYSYLCIYARFISGPPRKAAPPMTNPAPRALLPHTEASVSHRDFIAARQDHANTIVQRLGVTARTMLSALQPYFGSLALALAALAIAIPVNVLIDGTSISRVFLVAVLISAISYGLWPSMFAAFICVLIYDFFFIPPVYSLAIQSAGDIVNLAFFIVTAVVVSGLAARVRRYAVLADKRALTAEKLSAFTRRIGGAMTVADVLARSSEDIAAAMGTSAVTMLAEHGHLIRDSIRPTGTGPDASQLERLERTWATRMDRARPFRLDSWHILGLPSDEDTSCLIGVCLGWASNTLSAEDRHLLEAFAQQTVSAVEQNLLRQRLNDARVQIEAEEFGAALLNSISHDLRGPLTTILGATSALDVQWRALRDEAKIELVKTAREESEHLDAYIGNLLDITRLEFGAIGPKLVSLELADLVGSATHRVRAVLSAHRVKIDVSEDLPLVTADATLLQQTIVNLLDNASKYSPPGSLITVAATADEQSITLHVLDEGPGLLANDLDRIFDKFFRAPATRGTQPGTGLGLTICRGLVEAMHGKIEARNRTGHSGMCISITLPAAYENQLSQVE
jgi:two-component system, OmpR family, sensor histidine kinase KdpD